LEGILKKEAATGWPEGNERRLGIEIGRARSNAVGKLLSERLWICCKAD